MKTLLVLLTAILFFAVTASGQDSITSKKTFISWYFLNADHGKEKGITNSLTDTSVTLIRAEKFISGTNYKDYDYLLIPAENILKIKTRRKNSIGKGILIGGLSGAAFGALLGWLSESKDGDNGDWAGIVIGRGAMFFGIAGIGLGAAIGSIKVTIPINGNRNTFLRSKSWIEKYSLKRD